MMGKHARWLVTLCFGLFMLCGMTGFAAITNDPTEIYSGVETYFMGGATVGLGILGFIFAVRYIKKALRATR